MTAAATTTTTAHTAEKVSSLKNGWDPIARDLRRAWRKLSLGEAAAEVLDTIQEGCWVLPLLQIRKGDPRPEATACLLNLSELERQTGIRRTQLQRGLTLLLEMLVVIRVGDVNSRVYRINKDYTTWLNPARPATAKRPAVPATPRFDARDLRRIRSANHPGTRQRSYIDIAQPVASIPIHEAESCPNPGALPAPTARHPLPRIGGTPCPGAAAPDAPAARQPGAVPPTPPIGERPRGPRADESQPKACGELGEGDDAARLQIATTGPRKVPTPEASPPQPTPVGVISLQGKNAPASCRTLGGLPIAGTDSDEAKSLERWAAKQTFPGVGAVARGFCDALPVAWIEAAVRCRMVGHQAKGEKYLKNLLGKLLEGCRQSGACEWYGMPVKLPATTSAAAATDGSSPALDMHPAAVRRREIRESFGTSNRADEWARRPA